MGATPSALLRGCSGYDSLYSPKIKATSTIEVAISVGANGLKRKGGSIPPSRNPSTLVLGRTIDLIIPARGTDVNPVV
jgi:hypothetical protein